MSLNRGNEQKTCSSTTEVVIHPTPPPPLEETVPKTTTRSFQRECDNEDIIDEQETQIKTRYNVHSSTPQHSVNQDRNTSLGILNLSALSTHEHCLDVTHNVNRMKSKSVLDAQMPKTENENEKESTISRTSPMGSNTPSGFIADQSSMSTREEEENEDDKESEEGEEREESAKEVELEIEREYECGRYYTDKLRSRKNYK